MEHQKVLTYNTLSDNIKNAKYAVRGPIMIKAAELQQRLKAGEKLPFSEIFFCNVGNPQQLGQPPLTFNRQVLACMLDKSLLTAGVYNPDVISKAQTLYTYIPSPGAYAESQGIKQVRENCAKFILKRDGFPSNPNHIFLSNGASDSIKNMINCLIRDGKDGVMISVPRYPLYSADIVLKGGVIIPYYLNEETQWSLDMDDLEKNHKEALSKGVNPRAIVVINPGNPTGSILSRKNIEDVIKFCYNRRLLIIADEVYQHNVFDESAPFYSFKKVYNI